MVLQDGLPERCHSDKYQARSDKHSQSGENIEIVKACLHVSHPISNLITFSFDQKYADEINITVVKHVYSYKKQLFSHPNVKFLSVVLINPLLEPPHPHRLLKTLEKLQCSMKLLKLFLCLSCGSASVLSSLRSPCDLF